MAPQFIESTHQAGADTQAYFKTGSGPAVVIVHGVGGHKEDWLFSIKSPTLVIWGREDKLFPVALCPYLTSLTPGAKSVVIENASHFVQVDQPAALIQELTRFL